MISASYPTQAQVRSVDPARDRHAFTLIELLVVISIIAVLAGLSLPVISSVKESGNSVKCISNLKEIGTALDLYTNDNNNSFPPLTVGGSDWDTTAINPYLPERYKTGQNYLTQSILFTCPSAKYTGYNSNNISRTYSAAESMIGPDANGAYTTWGSQRKRTNLVSMTGTLLLFDGMQNGNYSYCTLEIPWITLAASSDLRSNSTTSSYIDYRHRKAFHGLYADGHVDTITRAQASAVVTKTMWTGIAQP